MGRQCAAGFVDQYIGNLPQYYAIAMDVGDMDNLRVDAGKLYAVLDSYDIANDLEIYHGTHNSAVADPSRTMSCRSSARIANDGRVPTPNLRSGTLINAWKRSAYSWIRTAKRRCELESAERRSLSGMPVSRALKRLAFGLRSELCR